MPRFHVSLENVIGHELVVVFGIVSGLELAEQASLVTYFRVVPLREQQEIVILSPEVGCLWYDEGSSWLVLPLNPNRLSSLLIDGSVHINCYLFNIIININYFIVWGWVSQGFEGHQLLLCISSVWHWMVRPSGWGGRSSK
jgi:hypothetical protein